MRTYTIILTKPEITQQELAYYDLAAQNEDAKRFSTVEKMHIGRPYSHLLDLLFAKWSSAVYLYEESEFGNDFLGKRVDEELAEYEATKAVIAQLKSPKRIVVIGDNSGVTAIVADYIDEYLYGIQDLADMEATQDDFQSRAGRL